MKLAAIAALAAIGFSSAIANAATAIVLVEGKNADAATSMLENWKNEKSLGEKLFTATPPEVATSAEMPGLPTGVTALVLGTCDPLDAEVVLPVLQALYPAAHGKTVETASTTTCPKLTSKPTKVAAKQTEKAGNATLTVVLFEGDWDRGETQSVAVGYVRDKDGDLVDTYLQRVGTTLGGEVCKADMKTTNKVVTINRSCEGTKEIETKKLSLAKGRLKID